MTQAGQARYEGDSWDLASSVGATATLVAAARAVATNAADPVINDPFAQPLVEAVGVEFFTKLARGQFDPQEIGPDASARLESMIKGMALRTKFFDEHFLSATAGGVRQAVILASGLDSRAYRLAWPPATTVFEVDQPLVIEFKTSTLTSRGAQPTAELRTVAVDLRDDWPAALRDVGFDPQRPTAWSAEGLLAYLPPEAQNRLFDNITTSSAPGSVVAANYRRDLTDRSDDRSRAITEQFRQHGLEIDVAALVFTGQRQPAEEYLAELGWRTQTTGNQQLSDGIAFAWTSTDDELFAELVYVTGVRP
jgi:methyltransferase (TIGR00027 family)